MTETEEPSDRMQLGISLFFIGPLQEMQQPKATDWLAAKSAWGKCGNGMGRRRTFLLLRKGRFASAALVSCPRLVSRPFTRRTTVEALGLQGSGSLLAKHRLIP